MLVESIVGRLYRVREMKESTILVHLVQYLVCLLQCLWLSSIQGCDHPQWMLSFVDSLTNSGKGERVQTRSMVSVEVFAQKDVDVSNRDSSMFCLCS